ncbi:Alpha-L-rhamnosidase rgxB [Cladobotryum mycophilum]|uniref:Alpha-L-rhamnosidase rgxB n=1 Tax=Cladobotryum mycophilum TaxID=491253 RepID=A0ABR0SCM8_9HYPO
MKGLLALVLTALALPVSSAPAPDPNNAHNEAYWAALAKSQGRQLCYVLPDAKGGNDALAIMDALNNKCRTKGLVVFPGSIYHINTNMTTLDLDDVSINQFGRFLWSTDIDYWLSVSMPVGFQNQSTVWYFGGDKVNWNGYNVGTFDGNGQVWYDWARSQGNLPRRPMNINFRTLKNSVVKGLRFVQSQMWTMAITYSKGVDLEDIYVNSTSNSQWSTLNTDGCDTVYSDNITFRRWVVSNGDDGIALKGNSSNISIYDSYFENGQGIAIGSMGQYNGKYEYITNFYAKNITLRNTAHVSYLKTWAGISNGYPPNGGGGGLGIAKDIVMEDIKVEGLRQEPFFAWQCENYSGLAGKNCDTSKFKLQDVAWRRVSGWTTPDVIHAGHFQCSAAAGGCNNIEVTDFNVTNKATNQVPSKWYCHNVNNPIGFTCNDA